ncbi:MAG: GFA family protein [Hyphomonadaceae bacterium]
MDREPNKPAPVLKKRKETHRVAGRCLCGAVTIEIDFPAFWSWHDHSSPSRRAHGAAYATYIGCWRSRVHVTKGQKHIARYEDRENHDIRQFCARCGSPLFYERKRWNKMINIPRALFVQRIGREPRYHIAIEEMQDWAYVGARLVPLKGYPGVGWDRARKRKRGELDGVFDGPEL